MPTQSLKPAQQVAQVEQKPEDISAASGLVMPTSNTNSTDVGASDTVANHINPIKEADAKRTSRFYFGIYGLSYGGLTHVAANEKLATASYRLSQLGFTWGGLAQAGYSFWIRKHWSLSGELDLGILKRQGRYSMEPGGGADFSHQVLPNSLGFTAQPLPTTEIIFNQNLLACRINRSGVLSGG